MPTFNQARYLTDAIESVLRQNYTSWELIIIDDNSEDNTQEVLQRYRGTPNISIYKTDGIKLPAVCNFAIAKSQGEYIIRLDGDDIFDENILLVLGSHLDKNEDTVLVFPDYFLLDENGNILSHQRRRRLHRDNHLMEVPPNGACMLIRKSIFKEIDGYREDLGVQDGFDLWTQVHTKYKCDNVNLPLFYYRRHDQNTTNNASVIFGARRKIKQDSAAELLENVRPISVVIPCRQHYDFKEDLWKVELGGETLLKRDLKVCLKSKLFDSVIVTCDNPEAEDCVREFSDSRLSFKPRSRESTIQSTSMAITLEKIVSELDADLNGVTLIRYIQTPFVTVDILEEAVATLVLAGADSAVAVEVIQRQLYRRSGHGLEAINIRGELSSDFDTLYRDASTCVATRNKYFSRGNIIGPSVVGFEVTEKESLFIGSEIQYKLAELLLELKKNKNFVI